jgi:hypothetical protein
MEYEVSVYCAMSELPPRLWDWGMLNGACLVDAVLKMFLPRA